jgi:hypothetical protein
MIAMTIGFLLTAFFGVVSAHIPLEKGVLVLDDHNFDDALAVRCASSPPLLLTPSHVIFFSLY